MSQSLTAVSLFAGVGGFDLAFRNAGVKVVADVEIDKAARSDWLAELKQPDKAMAFIPYLHYWSLAVSDLAIVKDGELPEGWGLYLVREVGVRVVVKPRPNREIKPMPEGMRISFLRQAVRAEVAHALKNFESRQAMEAISE